MDMLAAVLPWAISVSAAFIVGLGLGYRVGRLDRTAAREAAPFDDFMEKGSPND